ncbi:MAG: hypothetical protein HY305_07755, partial [Sphingobacteriales bacterium]|nr:hypothetical protein [Sphingobacteriales bacterium]
EQLNLEKIAGLASVEYFDFYPDKGQLIAMKKRIHYEAGKGNNENFIQNIFHFIQQTGFNDTAFLNALSEKPGTPEYAKKCIADIINGNPIPDEFIDAFLNIPKVNLNFDEVIAATSAY